MTKRKHQSHQSVDINYALINKVIWTRGVEEASKSKASKYKSKFKAFIIYSPIISILMHSARIHY